MLDLIEKLSKDVSDMKAENEILSFRTTELTIAIEALLVYMQRKGIFDFKEFQSIIDSEMSNRSNQTSQKSMDIEDKSENPLERNPIFKSVIGEA